MIHRLLTLTTRAATLATGTLIFFAPLAWSQSTQDAIDQNPTYLFSMPRLNEQLQTVSAALSMRRLPSAAQGLLRLTKQYPWHMESHYLLATLHAVQNKTDLAFNSLEKAIQLGFSNQALLYKDKNLAKLREDPRFQQLAEKLITAPAAAKPKTTPRKNAYPVRDQRALITIENTIWDSRIRLLKSYFKFQERDAVTAPVQSLKDAAATELNNLFKHGLAAGNVGDIYDNRDRAQSTLWSKLYPQLSFTNYSEMAASLNIDYGLNTKIAFSGVTFGNSSAVISSEPFWRSQARLAYTVPGGPQKLFLQYMNNQLYIFPANNDFGAEGDLLTTNTPYLILSDGKSGSEKPFLRAVATILAAFKPAEKDFLAKSGKLMAAVQMVFRRGQKPIETADDYLSAAAHPAVFQKENIDLTKMIQLANNLKADDFPSIVQLSVQKESQPEPGIDDFSRNLPEQLFNTPASIARIIRSSSYTKTLDIQAHSAVKKPGKNVTYKWVILQGEKAKINISPKNKSGSKVTITSAWHDKFPINGRNDINSNRVEIAVFADNGANLSAPSFITLLYPENQQRSYDDHGKLLLIDHAAHAEKYTDPQVFADRDWKDSFSYDSEGQLLGWVRSRKSGDTDFTRHGALILEKDSQGRAIKAEKIGYQYRRETSGHMKVMEKPLGEFLEYQYSTDEDKLGTRIKN